MTGSTSINISIKDLGIAYRKAKADLFYSSVLCRLAFMEYEEELEANLEKRHESLCNGGVIRWGIGSWVTTKAKI